MPKKPHQHDRKHVQNLHAPAAEMGGHTSQMLFPASLIVAYLTHLMSLRTGNVILTGTPPGVAFNKTSPDYLAVGDVLKLGIAVLGQHRCRIEAHDNARPG